MSDEEHRDRWHRQIETIKRAVKNQSQRGLYLRGLRACRTAAMLNQRELAARAHTYQSTINALERQGRAASPTMVRRLCEALDVGPADLCSADQEDLPRIPLWAEKNHYRLEPTTGPDNPEDATPSSNL